jgi:hypothetical protein
MEAPDRFFPPFVAFLKSEPIRDTDNQQLDYLVNCKAVDQPVSARALQLLLATSSGPVGRVPRSITAAGPVMMADLAAAVSAVRPVSTSVVITSRERRSVELRTGQDIVSIRAITAAVYHLAIFVQRGRLDEVAASPRLLKSVAVEMADVLSDHLPVGILPRTTTDTIPCIHGGLTT